MLYLPAYCKLLLGEFAKEQRDLSRWSAFESAKSRYKNLRHIFHTLGLAGTATSQQNSKWNDMGCLCFMQIQSNSINSTNRPNKHFLMSGCGCLIRSYSYFLSGPINTPKIGLAKTCQTTHKKHITRIKRMFEATPQFCHFVFAKIIAVWTGHCLNSDCGAVRCAWLAGV